MTATCGKCAPPASGESTGLHAVDEINGCTHIMSNFQHAGAWGGIHAKVKATLEPLLRANCKDKSRAAVPGLRSFADALERQSDLFLTHKMLAWARHNISS
jgi:hypothetical protein